jgi:hypothetical protein
MYLIDRVEEGRMTRMDRGQVAVVTRFKELNL